MNFWSGLAIGTLFGGGLLILYNWLFGEPHDRRMTLFNIKADEIRRARGFLDAFTRVWNDHRPRSPGVTYEQRQEIADEFEAALRDGKTYHVTLLKATRDAHIHLHYLADHYLEVLRGNPNFDYEYVQKELGPTIEAFRRALDDEVALFLAGKGFPGRKRGLLGRRESGNKTG